MSTSNALNAGKVATRILGRLLTARTTGLAVAVRLILLWLCLPVMGSGAAADTLSIATASNFRPVLEQLSEAFVGQQVLDPSTHQITISSASSGVLYAQILQRAPFQLFFSANESYPEKLVAGGRGASESLATYAIGKLVLVSRREGVNPKEILSEAKRIAIANPRTAPYGIAAMEAMENLGVVEESKSKLVIGNNIAQAWQFFHSGNADVAIVAGALVVSVRGFDGRAKPLQGLFTIDLSPHLTHPVRQSRVAIKPVSSLTQQFLDFMKTPVAKKIIVDGGYLLPMTNMNLKQ